MTESFLEKQTTNFYSFFYHLMPIHRHGRGATRNTRRLVYPVLASVFAGFPTTPDVTQKARTASIARFGLPAPGQTAPGPTSTCASAGARTSRILNKTPYLPSRPTMPLKRNVTVRDIGISAPRLAQTIPPSAIISRNTPDQVVKTVMPRAPCPMRKPDATSIGTRTPKRSLERTSKKLANTIMKPAFPNIETSSVLQV